MARTEKRAHIPAGVRQALWIAAAGRCEFRGCNKPVSRDFLTGRRANIAELAHVVSDSPDFARGDDQRSVELAKDGANLMLACFDCHSRVDRYGKNNEYTEAELLAMKREHEARIELIYSANGVKDSLPLLMTFPIGPQPPIIHISDINHAILQNTKYTRFPTGRHVHIDRSDFDLTDGSPDFWPRAEAALQTLYDSRVRPEMTRKDAPTHLTIAAFAPMPLLMKLGSLIGDKMEASVLDLPTERWLWDTRPDCPAPSYVFDKPTTLPREVAVEISISGRVQGVSAVHTDKPVLKFGAAAPDRGIIRADAHLQDFRRNFNSFLLGLVGAGARVIHLHPAAPLSANVELGRLLLAKTLEEVHVWDWQAPTWVNALRIR